MRLVLGGLAVALVTAACTTTVSGQGGPGGPRPTGSGATSGAISSATSSGSTAPAGPAYTPPADGSGYSIQPTDQLQPLPGLLSRRGCDWLAALKPKLKSLGATSTAQSASGCQILFPAGEVAQIHIIGPYHDVVDDTTYLKSTTIAGLEGRFYSFEEQKTDTICSVAFNPRSLQGITVDGYNTKATGGAFPAHCQLAGKVATALVTMFVPLAGGHPWPATPQQPSPATLGRRKACDVVTDGTVVWANDMSDKNPKAGATGLGSTCDFTRAGYGTIHVLLTSGTGGLTSVPPTAGTTVTDARAGVMAARTEQGDRTCTVSVQLSTGQVLQLTYTLGSKLTYDPYPQTVCLATQAATFDSLAQTMSEQ
jgi:hypothetical protein